MHTSVTSGSSVGRGHRGRRLWAFLLLCGNDHTVNKRGDMDEQACGMIGSLLWQVVGLMNMLQSCANV
jgi:hypothetical protein